MGDLPRAVDDAAAPGVAEAAVGEQGVELLEGALQGGVVGLACHDEGQVIRILPKSRELQLSRQTSLFTDVFPSSMRSCGYSKHV